MIDKAGKAHLWIAICSYLLLARINAVYNSPYSISEIRMLISVSALTKKDLKDLVTEPQPLTTNQDVNELTLFSKINASVLFYKYMKNAILYTVSRYPNNIIKAIKLMAAIPPPDTTLVMIMVDM